MNATPRALRWIAVLLVALGFAVPNVAQAQPVGSRGITIDFKSVKCGDEDDPITHDEPYLIVTKFRFKVESAGSGFRIATGTLKVENVMSGHGSLGNKKENYTREGRLWTIPEKVPHLAQEVVPPNEAGWVVGAAVTFMERDGFKASTADLLSRKVRDLVHKSITTMSFSKADSKKLSDVIMKRVINDLTKSAKGLDIGGIVHGLASAVDPDDYGGTALIVTVTGEAGKVYYSVGMPTDRIEDALAGVRPIDGKKEFSLRFPMGDLSKVPSNARYQGRSAVRGEVRIWRVDRPF